MKEELLNIFNCKDTTFLDLLNNQIIVYNGLNCVILILCILFVLVMSSMFFYR